VNQDGERIKGFQTNTLTVMANESYEDFAKPFKKRLKKMKESNLVLSKNIHLQISPKKMKKEN